MVELATSLGMSQATISEWEKGNKFPRAAALQGLARHFDVPMEYFFKDNVFLTIDTITVPLYTTISQFTLNKINDFTDEHVKYIKIPTSFIASYVIEDSLQAFIVPNDSMNRLFPKGSTIISKHIEQAELKDNDIIIYYFKNEVAIGRFMKNEARKVYLFKPESSSSDYYDVAIPFEEIQNVEIFAKVIWYGVSV